MPTVSPYRYRMHAPDGVTAYVQLDGTVTPEMYPPTEAEKHYDTLVAERRLKGRETYKRGLTHTDAYDWNRMALEEAMDLSQYLAAENLRLLEQVRALSAQLEGAEDVLRRSQDQLPAALKRELNKLPLFALAGLE